MTEATRAQWHAALMGTVVAGTVTDDVTGETAAYRWTVDNVLWDGFSPHLRVVLNNGAGGWREFGFAEGDPLAVVATMDAALAGAERSRLAEERFADLIGGEV